MRDTVKAALWAILGFAIGFIVAGLTSANAEEKFTTYNSGTNSYTDGRVSPKSGGYTINKYNYGTGNYSRTTITPQYGNKFKYNTYNYGTGKTTYGTIDTDVPIMGIFGDD